MKYIKKLNIDFDNWEEIENININYEFKINNNIKNKFNVFIKFLNDNNVYDEFFNNLINYHKNKKYKDYFNLIDPYNWIMNAFSWHNDNNYNWASLHNKWSIKEL